MTSAEQNLRFRAWTTNHAAILHHVANGFADGADRLDLMQELLLAVWKAIPAFRGTASVSTFIYRVAHNTALGWHRQRRTYQSHVERFENLVPRETHAAPASSSREHETLELLYAHIRQFPAVDRSLLLLHLDGLNYAEMAEIHGLSETNVGTRLSRLKQKLTQQMKDVSHELR